MVAQPMITPLNPNNKIVFSYPPEKALSIDYPNATLVKIQTTDGGSHLPIPDNAGKKCKRFYKKKQKSLTKPLFTCI